MKKYRDPESFLINMIVLFLAFMLFAYVTMLFGCATPPKSKGMGWQGHSMQGITVTQLQSEDGTFINTTPVDPEIEARAKRKAEFLRRSGFR